MKGFEFLRTPRGDLAHAVRKGTARSLCGKTEFSTANRYDGTTCLKCSALLAQERASLKKDG